MPNDPAGPDNQPQSSWLARSIARIALTAPRFVPARTITFPIRRKMLAAGAQPFTVNLPDDVTIDALFFEGVRDAAASPPARLAVVMNHGYVEPKEFHHGEVELLRNAGHNVVLYDLRAHGRSTGEMTTLGVHDQDDLIHVIDECQNRRFVGDRVITMGYSTGAATVIQHAPLDDRVAAVVALTPFADLIGAIRSFNVHYGAWYQEEALLRGFEALAREKAFDPARSDTIEAISKLTVPLFLAVGDSDTHLPPEQHAHRLRDAAVNCDIEFHTVPGRDHVTIYSKMTKELGEAIVAFCARHSAAIAR